MLLISFVTVSCSKDEVRTGYDEILGYTTVKLNLGINDDMYSKAEGEVSSSDLKDLHIWAYRINSLYGTPVDENEICADYAFLETYTQNESINFEVPVYSGETYYRFFAVANVEEFGEIYSARSNNDQIPLQLNGQLSYKEISSAIFDAKVTGGVMTPEFNKSIDPFSHWEDYTIPAYSSLQNYSTSENLEITLVRPVAKCEFNVTLSDGTNQSASLKIKSVGLRSKNIAVAIQGALFSDYKLEDLQNATSPSIFGNYSNFKVGWPSGDNWIKTGNAIEITKDKPATEPIAQRFIYENHHGDSSTETSTPDSYNDGAYYLKVDYDYKISSNSGEKTGTSYISLPSIVRNCIYKVNAEFDISSEGKLILSSYTVKEWEDGGTQEVNFQYPTIEVSAVKTVGTGNDMKFDYSKPYTYFNTKYVGNSPVYSLDDNGFGFYFKMSSTHGVEGRQWTVHCNELTKNANGDWVEDQEQNDDFKLVVFRLDNSNFIKEDGLSFSPSDNQYVIKIYPLKEEVKAAEKAAEIYITYYASWLGAADELLINTSGGGTLWEYSGGERYKILVEHGGNR